jgi:hypothetical protein
VSGALCDWLRHDWHHWSLDAGEGRRCCTLPPGWLNHHQRVPGVHVRTMRKQV